MSETPQHSQIDTEYATSVRYTGLGSGEKPFARQAIDMDRLSTQDGVHAELDRIVTQTAAVAESDALSRLPEDVQDKIRSGHVLAGHKNPKTGESEMGIMSPEAFRSIVARSVGHEALQAYEAALTGKDDVTGAVANDEVHEDEGAAQIEAVSTDAEKRQMIDGVADFRTQMMRIADAAHQDPAARDSVDGTLVRSMQEAGSYLMPGSTGADTLMMYGAAAGRVRSSDAVHAVMATYMGAAQEIVKKMDEGRRQAMLQLLQRIQSLSDVRFRGAESTLSMQGEADQTLFDFAQKATNTGDFDQESRQIITSAVLLTEGLADSAHATQLVSENLGQMLELNIS